MRLFELDQQEDIEKWITLIQSKCSIAIRSMKKANKFLYHGSKIQRWHDDSKHSPTKMTGNFIYSITKERTPYAPFPNAEKLLQRSGFDALRSNSLFCSGDIETASSYGTVYAVFPVDGFNFTWSKSVSDYFNYANDHNYKSMTIDEFLSLEQFDNTDLPTALRSGHAIYIKGEFIAVQYTYKTVNYLEKLINRR